MKKLGIILLLAVLAAPAFCSDLSFSVSIDWQMSLQGGIEYQITDMLGLKAGLGVSVLGMSSLELYTTVNFPLENSPWSLRMLAGIPNFNVPFSFDAAMLSFGAACEVTREITNTMSIGLRAGEGFPLFFEKDKELIRDIQFPMNLWPELAVEINFH